MPPLSRRLSLLRAGDPTSAASIIAAALGQAEPGELDELVTAAIETGRPTAWAAAIRIFDRLAPELRHALARAPGPMAEAIARAIRTDSGGERGALRTIALRGDPTLLEIALGRLDDEELGEPAARSVLEVTRRALDQLEWPTVAGAPPDSRWRALDEALTHVAETVRGHRQRSALLAIALAEPRSGRGLAAIMDDDEHPVHAELRRLPEEVDDPLVRANLVRWLGRPGHGRAVPRWLHRLGGAFGELLEDGHLLLTPSRRHALKPAMRPLRCVPPMTEAAAMSPRSQNQLAGYIARLDLSARARALAFAELMVLPSAVARWRVVETLATLARSRATPILERFMFDRDATVARAALHARGTAGHGPLDLSIARRLQRAPHGVQRRHAVTQLVRRDANAMLEMRFMLPAHAWRAAGVCHRRQDAAAWATRLSTWLASDEVPTQHAAVGLIRRQGLGTSLEAGLLEAATSAEPRLLSAIAAALGAAPASRVGAHLRRWLEHADRRVRANALEALGRRDPDAAVDAALVALADPDNRIRANAVRIVERVDAPRARVALRAMLRDPRALHRVSALWVAGRSRIQAVGDDVKTLAHADPVPEIRGRAEAAGARLGVEFATRPMEAAS